MSRSIALTRKAPTTNMATVSGCQVSSLCQDTSQEAAVGVKERIGGY